MEKGQQEHRGKQRNMNKGQTKHIKKDRKGKTRKGHDRTGQDRKGKEQEKDKEQGK